MIPTRRLLALRESALCDQAESELPVTLVRSETLIDLLTELLDQRTANERTALATERTERLCAFCHHDLAWHGPGFCELIVAGVVTRCDCKGFIRPAAPVVEPTAPHLCANCHHPHANHPTSGPCDYARKAQPGTPAVSCSCRAFAYGGGPTLAGEDMSPDPVIRRAQIEAVVMGEPAPNFDRCKLCGRARYVHTATSPCQEFLTEADYRAKYVCTICNRDLAEHLKRPERCSGFLSEADDRAGHDRNQMATPLSPPPLVVAGELHIFEPRRSRTFVDYALEICQICGNDLHHAIHEVPF